MTEETKDRDGSIPFYPDHVRTEFLVAVGFTVLIMIIGILGILRPIGLGEPADPLNTPAHVKPEWYFLALYQVIKYVPKTVGVLIPLIGVGLITLWPFLDKKADIPKKSTQTRFIVVIISTLILIALTVWGEIS